MKRLLGCWVSALLLPLFCVAQPEECRTVRDVPYREAGDSLRDDPMCRLDLVCPAGAEGFPTVVWFHGGGLTGGRREIPEELLAGRVRRRGGGVPPLAADPGGRLSRRRRGRRGMGRAGISPPTAAIRN